MFNFVWIFKTLAACSYYINICCYYLIFLLSLFPFGLLPNWVVSLLGQGQQHLAVFLQGLLQPDLQIYIAVFTWLKTS